jgi:hypothetical protein
MAARQIGHERDYQNPQGVLIVPLPKFKPPWLAGTASQSAKDAPNGLVMM